MEFGDSHIKGSRPELSSRETPPREKIAALETSASAANLPVSLKPILLPFKHFPDIYSE